MSARRSDRRRPLVATAVFTLGLLAIGMPLVIVPSSLHAFTLPKLLVSEVLGLLSLVLLALAVARGEIAVGVRRLRDGPALRVVAPILLVATVGLLSSDHPLYVRRALVELWIGAVCLVGWSVGLGRRRLRRILDLLIVPALVMAALAVLQYVELFQPFEFRAVSETGRMAATALAGNAAALAAFLVIPTFLVQLRLREAWSGGRRIFWSLALLVLVAGLVVTQTLTAIAALLVGSLLLWAFLVPTRRLVAGVVACTVAVTAVIALFAPLRERIVDRADLLRRGEVNVLLTGRLDGWRAAGWMLRQEPLSGVGHGAYRAEFAAAKLALTEDGVPFYRSHLYPTFANAHNDYLEAAAEWGVPGVLALLWGLWVTIVAVRNRSTDARSRSLAWAGVVGLAVLSATHFPWRLALTAYPGLLLLAWLFAEPTVGPADDVDGGGS